MELNIICRNSQGRKHWKKSLNFYDSNFKTAAEGAKPEIFLSWNDSVALIIPLSYYSPPYLSLSLCASLSGQSISHVYIRQSTYVYIYIYIIFFIWRILLSAHLWLFIYFLIINKYNYFFFFLTPIPYIKNNIFSRAFYFLYFMIFNKST